MLLIWTHLHVCIQLWIHQWDNFLVEWSSQSVFIFDTVKLPSKEVSIFQSTMYESACFPTPLPTQYIVRLLDIYPSARQRWCLMLLILLYVRLYIYSCADGSSMPFSVNWILCPLVVLCLLLICICFLYSMEISILLHAANTAPIWLGVGSFPAENLIFIYTQIYLLCFGFVSCCMVLFSPAFSTLYRVFQGLIVSNLRYNTLFPWIAITLCIINLLTSSSTFNS